MRRGAWSGDAADVARVLADGVRQELVRRPEDAAVLVRAMAAIGAVTGLTELAELAANAL